MKCANWNIMIRPKHFIMQLARLQIDIFNLRTTFDIAKKSMLLNRGVCKFVIVGIQQSLLLHPQFPNLQFLYPPHPHLQTKQLHSSPLFTHVPLLVHVCSILYSIDLRLLWQFVFRFKFPYILNSKLPARIFHGFETRVSVVNIPSIPRR